MLRRFARSVPLVVVPTRSPKKSRGHAVQAWTIITDRALLAHLIGPRPRVPEPPALALGPPPGQPLCSTRGGNNAPARPDSASAASADANHGAANSAAGSQAPKQPSDAHAGARSKQHAHPSQSAANDAAILRPRSGAPKPGLGGPRTSTEDGNQGAEPLAVPSADPVYFAGEAQDGIPSGSGHARWADTSYFSGSFENGKPHGNGRLCIYAGRGNWHQYQGSFAEGQLVADGDDGAVRPLVDAVSAPALGKTGAVGVAILIGYHAFAMAQALRLAEAAAAKVEPAPLTFTPNFLELSPQSRSPDVKWNIENLRSVHWHVQTEPFWPVPEQRARYTEVLVTRTDCDLTPLHDMSALRGLTVHCSQQAQIEQVAGCSQLTDLYVCSSRSLDLTPLGSLTSLKRLALFCPASVLPDFGALQALRALTLESGYTTLPDGVCNLLETLDISLCPHLRLPTSFFDKYRRLRHVALADASLPKIDETVFNLPYLSHLSVGRVPIAADVQARLKRRRVPGSIWGGTRVHTVPFRV